MSVSLKKRRIETHGPSGAAGGRIGLDARAVGQAPLEDRLHLVDVLADELRGVAERGDERLARLEARVGEVELALLLDVDLERAR